MRSRHLFLIALASAFLFAVAAPSALAVGSFKTVVAGLDNPRDLAFSPNGTLYVAEAGHGGDPADCIAGGPEGAICPGFTSGLSRVDVAKGKATRVVSRLASFSDQGGTAATGLDGISFLGNGTLYGIMAAARDAVPPQVRAALKPGLQAQLGRLIRINPNGRWKSVADVGHVDWVWSLGHQDLVPPMQFPDANPYGVLALGSTRWVVDAATNTIDSVGANGKVTIRQFIPNPPVSDSVPTCIDRGPDGALYIGELTGAGNAPGAASIWRYAPGKSLTKWATGLTAVTGCGFGSDGNFYATEFSTLGLENGAPSTGQVVRVAAGSTSPVVVVDGLSFPGGFAASRNGAMYVSNWSIAPTSMGTGAVVRITP